MSIRELVALGTGSQVPTRERAHHATLLRWGATGLLLDPGEGTQRQCLLAGVAASAITAVFITHAHGDHCLGLPGVLQRRSLDAIRDPLEVHHPAEASPYLRRLRHASAYDDVTDVRLRPAVAGPIDAIGVGDLEVEAVALAHSIPTLGWRFTEPDGWTLLPERLDALGVHGADRERLSRDGRITVAGRTITREQAAVPRPGQRVAHVMDTGWCDGALEVADGVDLLVVEATFLEAERDVAEAAGHLTAAHAARLAVAAGARRAVLTHISPRYPGTEAHEAEARRAAPELDLVVVSDLDRVAVPPRVTAGARAR